MTELILVRHGSTEWNEKERFRGHVDIELSAQGKKQASLTAKKLSTFTVKKIFSSPLKRALETATIIAEPHCISVEILDGINDINFGVLQGLTIEESKSKYGDIYRKWKEQPQIVEFPQGESLVEVYQRSTACVNSIVSCLSDGTYVFVSHKVIIKLLILHFLKMDISQFWSIEQDVCAINIFNKQDDYFYATTINDTCHLRNNDIFLTA